MSRFIKDWLVSNEEKAEEAPVIVQDGETPEEDFSAASAEIASDVETDKPAVAEIPAASDDDAEHKTEDQGHQTVTVSKEDDEETADEDESVSADKSEAEDDDADSADESGEDDVSAEDDAETKDTVDSETDEGEVVAELEPGEDDPKDDVSEVDGEDGTVEAGGVAEPTGEAEADDQAGDDSGESEADAAEESESESEDDSDSESEADAEAEAEEDDADVSVEEYEEEDTSIDYPVDAEAEAASEIEQTAGDVDALMEVGASLEAYHALLSQSLTDEGGISPLTAEMVRVGLESLDVSLGGEAVMLGMESFGVHSSRQMATQISLEGVSTALKSTLEAAKNALKRLFELLYSAWNSVTNGVTKAKKRLTQLKNELKEADSTLAPVETKISGAARLTLNGTFIGNDPASVKLLTNVTQYMYDTYPKSCVTFGKSFVDVATSGVSEGAENERLKVHGLVMSHFRTQSWETVSDKDGWKVMGVELPAGWKLERQISNDVNTKEIRNTELFKRTHQLSLKENFKVRFEKSDTDQSSDNTVTYTTPSVGDMKSMVGSVEGLIAAMEKQTTAVADYKKLQKIIEGGWSTTHGKTVGADVNLFVEMGRILTSPAGPYVGYIGRTVNGFVSVMEHNLKAMKKEASSAAGTELQPA